MKSLSGALIIVLACAATSVIAAEMDHRLAVTGDAETMLAPDFATVELGALTQAKTVAEALAENNERMARVVTALHALGVADKDIQTNDFKVMPQYPTMPNGYDEDRTKPIIGYYITNKVTVRLFEMSKIAKVIDTCFQAGANSGGSVAFGITNREKHLDALRQAAIANARHKAEIMAAAAGVKLGPAVTVGDTTRYGYVAGTVTQTVSPVTAISAVPDTPILPGRIPLNVSVSVVYELR
jgi:uncharacterized protein YggE